MRALVAVLVLAQLVSASTQNSDCGVEIKECPKEGNYSKVLLPFSDALAAYSQFVEALSRITKNATGEFRTQIFSDKQLVNAVRDFNNSVQVVFNNITEARAACESVAACLQGVIDASNTKKACHRSLITVMTVEKRGVDRLAKNVGLEYKSSEISTLEHGDMRVQLRNLVGRGDELTYSIEFAGGENRDLDRNISATGEHRTKVKELESQLQVIQDKLSGLARHVSTISQPNINHWLFFSVKQLLQVEELLDPMRQVAKLIAKFTGQPINSRFLQITDAQIDEQRHKYLKGDPQGDDSNLAVAFTAAPDLVKR